MSANSLPDTPGDDLVKIFSTSLLDVTPNGPYLPFRTNVQTRETVMQEWVPANGGTETAFTSRSGIRMLYCWNVRTGEHAYLNVDSDIIMTQEFH